MKKLTLTYSLKALGLASILGLSSSALAAGNGQEVGNPYVPTGADYKIYGVQGINAANPFGQANPLTQVNINFEDTPSIGVSYDTGAKNGKLTDGALGLYTDMSKNVFSTGLHVAYNAPVNAASVNIVVEDFDIDNKATAFNPNKVEPSILLLGANNSIYATITPSEIFPNLVATTLPGGQGDQGDIWSLNFGSLLTAAGKASAPITGYLLYADASNGEKSNSDPYEFVSSGNGTPVMPVPEVSTILPIVGLLTAILSTAVLRRRKQAMLAA